MTTNTFFKSKEHYQAFRKAWSNAVNSDAAKSHLEPCDEWIADPDPNSWSGEYSKGTGVHRVPGNVTAAHMMLYNALRGRDVLTGFSPITSTKKLQNGAYINDGWYWAHRVLAKHIFDANRILTESSTRELVYTTERVTEFLNVFNSYKDTAFHEIVTIKMLSEVKLPNCPAMYSNYGPYMKVAKHIIESNKGCKPSTFEHIQQILEHVQKEVA